jgi:hypothetical protein
LSALALASTARVADSAMPPILVEIRLRVVDVVIPCILSHLPVAVGVGSAAERAVSGRSAGCRTLRSLGASCVGALLRA